jgi:hypothetical protein
MKRVAIFFISFIILATLVLPQEKVKVNDIKRDFDSYKDEKVIIEGFVTQYGQDIAKTTHLYFLKDDWGGIIKVRTSQPLPEVGKKYQITGVVDKDILTEDIFISEENRIVLTPPPPETAKRPLWLYLIIALGGITIVLLIVVLIYALRERKAHTTEVPITPLSAPGEEPLREAVPEPEEVLEGSTVKLAVPPPGTLKLLPGKFTVLAGDDKIKEIRFYKEKSVPETEITFGRSGGPQYSHIQLKPRSVSVKHAKLIYANNKFTIINYSSTNPTRVNDEVLPENGSAELQNGDKIEIGELVFEFQTT